MTRLTLSLRPGPLPKAKRYRRGVCWLFLYAFSLLFTVNGSVAGEGGVVVYSIGSAPVYGQVAGKLKSYLTTKCGEVSDNCPPLSVHLLTGSGGETRPVIPADTKLIITLGQRAGEVICDLHTGIPVLHALIPQTTYQKLDKDSPHSAIFLDQPISRLLQLASVIRSDPHIGLLLSPLTKALRDELFAESEQQRIPVTHRTVGSSAVVGPLLKEVLEESNILLALPDPTIFNSTTIFNILLSSYHKRIPVIGFSSAYVKAGALVAAYSTPEDIARHLAEYTRSYLDSGVETMPDPTYPKYFSVSVNQSVARSLGISLPDEAAIIERMLEQGNP